MLELLLYILIFPIAAFIEIAFFSFISVIIYRLIFKKRPTRKQISYCGLSMIVIDGIILAVSLLTNSLDNIFPEWYALIYCLALIVVGIGTIRLTTEK
jgi:uncharacterized protein involved in response to NO